ETFNEVRPGYVTLTKSIDDLTEDVLADEAVQKQMQALKDALQTYMSTYWDKLKTVHDVNDVEPLKDEMLTEIKQLLKEFRHVSTYAGYQIIAELWENMLAEDTEKIAISDFYTVARTRETNMVTKGSGKTKRTEQDGWIGSIVPNDLILKVLYTDELKEVEAKQESVVSITDEITELVEAAKVEESEEEAVLGETLNAREDDFTLSAVRSEIKNVEKGSAEYELLDKVKNLLDEKSALNKDIKAKEKALNEKVEDKIENLTDAEIDQLMYQKWFGDLTNNMTGLIEIPLKNELDTLKELQARYADTLETIEKEFNNLGNFGKIYPFSRSVEGVGRFHHIHYGDIHTKSFGIIENNSKLPTIKVEGSFELAKPGDIVIADASEDYKDLGKSVVIGA